MPRKKTLPPNLALQTSREAVEQLLEVLEQLRDIRPLTPEQAAHGAAFWSNVFDRWEPLPTGTSPAETLIITQWTDGSLWEYRAVLFQAATPNEVRPSDPFGGLWLPVATSRAETIHFLQLYLARHLAGLTADGPAPQIGPQTPFTPDSIRIPSGPVVQATVRGIQAGKEKWNPPHNGEPAHYKDQNGAQLYIPDSSELLLLKTLQTLDYETGITFLVCLGKWMADTGGDPNLRKTTITVQDVLSFQDIKKHAKGGYRLQQKQRVRDQILTLNEVWVKHVEERFSGTGKRRRKKEIRINSRLLEIATEDEPGPDGTWNPYSHRVAPGEWIKADLAKDGPPLIALLQRSILNKDLRRGAGKMALLLGIYLSIQLRIRSATENWEQSWRVTTLLRGAGIDLPTDHREYTRFRKYVQEGLDALTAGNGDTSPNLLASWQYDRCSEKEPVRNWWPEWLEFTVKVVPAPAAIEPYRKIAPHRQSALAKTRKN